MRTFIVSICMTVLLGPICSGTADAGATAEAKCQAGKNKAAGQYAACRQLAESKLLTTAGTCSVAAAVCYRDEDCPLSESCAKDTAKHAAAIVKCETKLSKAWSKLDEKAADAGATCPDTPLSLADLKAVIDAQTANVANALAGTGLQECPLAGCSTNQECPAAAVCAAGACVAPGSVGSGGSCSANRDCSTSLYCSPHGVCSAAGSGHDGDACATGADCDKSSVCALYGLGGNCVDAGTADLGETCASTQECLGGLACDGSGHCVGSVDAFPPFAGVSCPADLATFKVFFQVPRSGMPQRDFFRLPFPNDARVNDAGTLDMADFPRPGPSILGVDIVDLYADALSEDFDGFSTVASVTFRMSKELDFDSIGADGANAHLVDVTDPTSPDFGADHVRSVSYTNERTLYACQHVLQVAPLPHEPLLPGHTYAVYLSSSIRSATGDAPVLDTDLAAVLASGPPSDQALSRVWTQYANFRTFLAQQSLTPADVAAVTVFTVQDATAPMAALAAAVAASPLPALSSLTLCDGMTTSPCAIAGDTNRVCGDSTGSFYEIHGRLSIPNYQQGTLPYETPAAGGQINYDATGHPIQNGTLEVCFALTVPKSAAPVNGYPLVVHAHGTGGSFREAISTGIAEMLATATTTTGDSVAMATLTFDGVGHGERRGASTRDSDGLVFNVVNPRAARDNHLQGGVDVMQALRVAQLSPQGVGGLVFSLDASRTYYFGHSQGSNVGIPAVAATDLAKAAVLSGAGSYLTEGILHRTSPVNAAASLTAIIGEPIGGGHPLMVIWQTFFDRIDPINYDAPMLRRPPPGRSSKHVLMTWGQGDTYSPESTLNFTARALGLDLAQPVVSSINGLGTVARPVSLNRTGGDGVSRTAVLVQYQSNGAYDGHFVSTRNPSAVSDWTNFLASAALTGTPVVP